MPSLFFESFQLDWLNPNEIQIQAKKEKNSLMTAVFIRLKFQLNECNINSCGAQVC
jgi:hypothetical protein